MDKINNSIANDDGTYTIVLSAMEFCEVIKGLTYMEKRRESSREYKRKKNLHDPYNPTGEGSIPTIHLHPIIHNSMYTLIISAHELKEIKKALKYLEKQHEAERNYYSRKVNANHQTFPIKHLALNIVNPVK